MMANAWPLSARPTGRHFTSKKSFDGRDFYGLPAIASQVRDVENGTTNTPH